MAKTFRNLWPELVSWPNLLQAYRRCRRRKRYRQPATAFDFAWEVELLQLQRELTCGDYLPGAYSHFHISANVLLNPIDHYIRETLRIPGMFVTQMTCCCSATLGSSCGRRQLRSASDSPNSVFDCILGKHTSSPPLNGSPGWATLIW